MRIAAYCAGYEPEAGGGYTFESEVLEALLQVAGTKPGMDFVLLCPEANAKALGTHVAGSGLAVRAVTAGFADRLLQPFLRESAFVRAHWRRPSAIDRAAAGAGADLVWFLGAGVHYTNSPVCHGRLGPAASCDAVVSGDEREWHVGWPGARARLVS